MKFKGDKVIFEECEPMLRSCWECNSCHEHLKKVTMLHKCFECGRAFAFGEFINSDADAIKLMKKHGLKEGESSSKIDLGYRVYCMVFEPKEEKVMQG